ncbi:MAG: YczE/YyaS/YitT family protein [Actinomycetota bacterium]
MPVSESSAIPPMATDRLVERITRCVIGLAFFGIGISMVMDARIGAPPWDVFHQGVAERVDREVGTVIIATGAALMLLWIPLRQKPGIGTILNAIEIGLVANVALAILPRPDSVFVQVPMMLGGVVVTAIGSGLYIGSGLGPGPRDGIMTGLAARGVPLRIARTGIEVTVLVVGWFLGGQVGVGTVAFAVLIGPLVQVFLPRLTMKMK